MERQVPINHALEHLKSLKVVPAEVISAVVAFSGTSRPQFAPDRVCQALLNWRGDLERYIQEQLGADEVLVVLQAERMKLVVSGAPVVSEMPFYFFSELALLPTELERLAPEFARFIGELAIRDRQIARGHLERAMAVCAWVLLRLAFEDGLHQAKEAGTIAGVSPDGVDLMWKLRPAVELSQSLRDYALVVRAKMGGEIVPKRKVTVPQSVAIN